MGERNELKNRYLHVDYKKVKDKTVARESKNTAAKCHSKMSQQNVTVKISERQKKILEIVKQNPNVLQTELAEQSTRYFECLEIKVYLII